jgi:hypothetical protein
LMLLWIIMCLLIIQLWRILNFLDKMHLKVLLQEEKLKLLVWWIDQNMDQIWDQYSAIIQNSQSIIRVYTPLRHFAISSSVPFYSGHPVTWKYKDNVSNSSIAVLASYVLLNISSAAKRYWRKYMTHWSTEWFLFQELSISKRRSSQKCSIFTTNIFIQVAHDSILIKAWAHNILNNS